MNDQDNVEQPNVQPPQPAPVPSQPQYNQNPEPVIPGSPQPETQQPNSTQSTQQTDVLGIISLVLIVFIPFVGAIVGFVGMNKAKKEGYSGTLSKVGAIINTILTVLGIIFFVLWLVAFFFITKNIDSANSSFNDFSTELQTVEQQNSYSNGNSYEGKQLFFALPASDSEWTATVFNQGGVNSFSSNDSTCSVTTYQRLGADRAKSQGSILLDSIEAQSNLSTNNSASLPMQATGQKYVETLEGDGVEFDIYETTYNNNAGTLRIYGAWVGDNELMIAAGCLSSDWATNRDSINNIVDKFQLTTY